EDGGVDVELRAVRQEIAVLREAKLRLERHRTHEPRHRIRAPRRTVVAEDRERAAVDEEGKNAESSSGLHEGRAVLDAPSERACANERSRLESADAEVAPAFADGEARDD